MVATITEVFGIGIFLPIFQFIRFEGDIKSLIEDSPIWDYIINTFAYVGIDTSLLSLLIVAFIFFLSRQVFTYFRLVYYSAITQRIIQVQRNRIFDKYLKADTSYHDSVPVGNLVNLVTTEINRAVTGIMAPMVMIVYIIVLFFYVFILVFLSWEMTVSSIFILLLASGAPNLWIKKSKQIGRKLVSANTLMSEFLVGRLQSPRLVRLSGTEIAEKDEYKKLTMSQRKHFVFTSILQHRTEVAMEPIVIGLSLTFLYFSYTTLHLKIEIIGLYLVIVLRLLPVIKGVLSSWQTVQTCMGSIEIVEKKLKDMSDSVEVDLGVLSFIPLEKFIQMKNVIYRYPTSKTDTLTNINIKFKAGEMTALVGPSGSGKSTLIDLIPRLRTTSNGVITFDGIDIEKYTLKTLRKAISYVPQSPQIFNGKIKDHILYGNVNATEEEIIEAAQLAGAEGFINKLPYGFDTIIGENAVKLSGGQRQRLDLARALVSKASILILDEPTSNLDAESEWEFKQVITKIRKETKTTIIIVAHRLASVSDVDNIIVLNNGEVEASGMHVELLGQSKWYANAWRMQSSHGQ